MFTTHQNPIFLTTSSLLMILSLHNSFKPCDANCTTSSCGIIHNISSPFRLKGAPNDCGDPRLELACDDNVTSISLNSHKYYVKAITYGNYHGYLDYSTIRLVDASIINNDICSFPTFSTYYYNFTNPSYPYSYKSSFPINFISCPISSRVSSLFTDITTECDSNSSHHRYIRIGGMKPTAVPYTCRVDLIAMTSWYNFKDLKNVSLSQIHESLLYGFELTVCPECGTSKIVVVLGKHAFCHVISLLC
ncbi:hypothetical protein AAHA92_25778 [Salvia divinorum]|uniref:Wall-associated receptor kinase galacturonan-binding domain-containing protein n=1 Tax=Salvia divinorum TaxID=28513 RepID=A0ABD1GBR4_SALDI